MPLWTRLLREMTEDQHFSDLHLPLVVMTVDLEAGRPAPRQKGPLWGALSDMSAAVNLMNREPARLARRRGAPPRGTSALEVLPEAMELTHTDASTRHAALAGVTITPRFGPSTWRDFPLADAFLAAGRVAAAVRSPREDSDGDGIKLAAEGRNPW